MINTTIKNKKTRPYPKYMIAGDGTIVLFSEVNVGMVLKESTFNDVGEYSTTWKMDGFTDYNEVITTQNKEIK